MLPVPPRPEPSGTPPPPAAPAGGRFWSYVLVFLLGLTSPLWCCLLCAVAEYPLRPVAYLIHGRWPADGDLRRKLDEGMTEDEVLAAAGRPHRRDSKWNGTANWFYYHDSDGFDSAIVEFDERKRVRFAYKP